MRPAARSLHWLVVVLFVALLPSARVAGQAMTFRATSGVLRVDVPPAGLFQRDLVTHLHDGRSLRVELTLSVLDGPGGAVVAERRETFNLSFDLWEERFAVTWVAASSESISHLTAGGAEAWCLDRLSVPLPGPAGFGRAAPFWLRLGYRVDQPIPVSESGDGFTLRRLIEFLGRRNAPALTHTVEAGPFRLPG